jgi:hypothetical protein
LVCTLEEEESTIPSLQIQALNVIRCLLIIFISLRHTCYG